MNISVFVTNAIVFGLIWFVSGLYAAQLNLGMELASIGVVLLAVLLSLEYVPKGWNVSESVLTVIAEILWFLVYLCSVTFVPSTVQSYIDRKKEILERYEVIQERKPVELFGKLIKLDPTPKTDLCTVAIQCTEKHINEKMKTLRKEVKSAEATKKTLGMNSSYFNSIVYFTSNFIVIAIAFFRHRKVVNKNNHLKV